jgi:protein disulfide-isomerase
MRRHRAAGYALLTGLALGLAAYHVALVLSGRVAVPRDLYEEQEARLGLLQDENEELTEELLRPRAPVETLFSEDELPYDEQIDATSMVETARRQAQAEAKFLMVTFGANWCLDCRMLHRHLNSEPVASYTRDQFRFVNIDVGKFNRNRDVAESLGVSLTRGIPVAVFFSPGGEIIGTTNNGELEPSRHYSSQQILKFVRDVVERHRVAAPDSVQ